MLAAGDDGVRIWRVDDSLRRYVASVCDQNVYSHKYSGENAADTVGIYVSGGLVLWLRWQNAVRLGMVTSRKLFYVDRHVPAPCTPCSP